jgi:hypothetical protein
VREGGRYLFFFAGLAWSPVAIPPFPVAMMMNLRPSVYTRPPTEYVLLYLVSRSMMGDLCDGWVMGEMDLEVDNETRGSRMDPLMRIVLSYYCGRNWVVEGSVC